MFLHIDLDCFFVSASRVADPDLNGKVVAVAGGNKTDIFGDFIESGVIVSASYEARKLGIGCTMHSSIARKIYPNIIILPTNFNLYKTLSNNLFKLLLDYTDEIEKYSIDEFFLNLKGTKFENDPLNFAKTLQNRIKNELKLPSSIGISENKFIAKFATNLAKPSKIKVINDISEIQNYEIKMFPGVGKSAENFLKSHGVVYIKDAFNAQKIFEKLGKNGLVLYSRICGKSRDQIHKNRPRKSLCIARTFKEISDRKVIEKRLMVLCRYVSFEVFMLGLNPTKFELKIKYKNNQSINASVTKHSIFTQKLLETSIKELFLKYDKMSDFAITYLSVGVGGLNQKTQMSLFDIQDKKDKTISDTLAKIRLKYGVNVIKSGGEI
ncbi:DNA polymerase IV [Campylobacter fetus subsp. testudinum]|uniref:Y-family DNA polymerase n=1 Tax=Campylobacter fetus TaxID=196 RepID=UPI0008188B49|nr:DNA polymerase IV [Campylobacter fetus]OCR96517.1 DNA polymerase IV [Campylobacter fetus subsp. testudinum]